MTNVTLKQLLEAGSHFGHQVRRWNPAMKQYIFDQRDGVHIFDLVKTRDGIEKAGEFLKSVVADGGKVLLLGTKRQAAEAIKIAADQTGMPYVNIRWMAGLLTNWEQVGKSIRKFTILREQRERGELKKYTKREQLLLDREIFKLEKFFGGVASLQKLPRALFVVDTHREEVAVREAQRMGIPVVGMVDTNGDPAMVDYVIPVNDDAVKSIELVVEAMANAMSEMSEKKTEVKTGVKEGDTKPNEGKKKAALPKSETEKPKVKKTSKSVKK
jgi:small subunit ribosomal protein S2